MRNRTYCVLGLAAVLLFGAWRAFAVDFTGGRQHRIFVRNIATGEIVDTGIGQLMANCGSSYRRPRSEPGA